MPRGRTPRFPNRSRCDTCGYASGLKPGRACPECGGTMTETDDGFRKPDPPRFSRTWASWVALIVLILMVGLPILIWLRGIFG